MKAKRYVFFAMTAGILLSNMSGSTGLAEEYSGNDSGTSSSSEGTSRSVQPVNTDYLAFIQNNAATVSTLARQNDLYASVMMAQGILESAAGTSELAVNANNLFGIKYNEGQSNGNASGYYEKETLEEVNGELITITAKFRKYNSFADCFNDYIDKMRNGISSNPNFYSGAWIVNTSSYKDATAFLTGRWATDSTYASKLNTLIENYGLQQYDIGSIGSFDHVNESNRVFGSKVDVKGWVLTPSNVTIKSIDVYNAGNTLIGSGNTGEARDDVYNVYPYYNSRSSGYSISVPVSSIPSGTSAITVKAVLSSGQVLTYTKSVTKPDMPDRVELDSIRNGNTVSSIQSIEGWALLGEEVTGMDVYVNGAKQGSAEVGLDRSDVMTVFPEYQITNCGYRYQLDTRSWSGGSHTIMLRFKTASRTKDVSYTVNKEAYTAVGYLDSIQDGQAVSGDQPLSILGWAMSNREIKSVKLMADGKELKTLTLDQARPDVMNVFPNYGVKGTDGFDTTVELAGLDKGVHTLSLVVTTDAGSRTADTKKIDVKTRNFQLYLDTAAGSLHRNQEVSGWALSKTPIKSVDVYVNDKLVKTAEYGQSRPDVLAHNPEYGIENSGYQTVIDTSNLALGEHTIKVVAADEEGKTLSRSKTFRKRSLSNNSAEDRIQQNQNVFGTMTASGWGIGNSKLAKVSFSIGGTEVGSTEKFYARSDVDSVYPEYNTDGAGYTLELDFSRISGGKKTLVQTLTFQDGTTLKKNLEVNVQQTDDAFCVDYPSFVTEYSSQLTFSGWYLSLSKITSVKVMVKNVMDSPAETENVNVSRIDVYDAGYQRYNDKNSGFSVTIDNPIQDSGTYFAVFEFYRNGTKVNSTQREFVYNKLPIESYIDSPKNNQLINGNTVNVSGWALADDGLAKVEVRSVNNANALLASTSNFAARPDVQAAYPQYNTLNSGFSVNADTSNLPAGHNTLRIVFTTKTGRISSKTIGIKKNITIFIDAGHGGSDPGAVRSGIYEKNLTLPTAIKARDRLLADGHNVVMYRATDTDFGLSANATLALRVRKAEEAYADLFVSVHYNTSSNTSIAGVETYYYNGLMDDRVTSSRTIADKVQQSLASKTGSSNRGIIAANFHVLREASMPSILIEGGYMSNASELSKVQTAAYQNNYANGVAAVLANF